MRCRNLRSPRSRNLPSIRKYRSHRSLLSGPRILALPRRHSRITPRLAHLGTNRRIIRILSSCLSLLPSLGARSPHRPPDPPVSSRRSLLRSRRLSQRNLRRNRLTRTLHDRRRVGLRSGGLSRHRSLGIRVQKLSSSGLSRSPSHRSLLSGPRILALPRRHSRITPRLAHLGTNRRIIRILSSCLSLMPSLGARSPHRPPDPPVSSRRSLLRSITGTCRPANQRLRRP